VYLASDIKRNSGRPARSSRPGTHAAIWEEYCKETLRTEFGYAVDDWTFQTKKSAGRKGKITALLVFSRIGHDVVSDLSAQYGKGWAIPLAVILISLPDVLLSADVRCMAEMIRQQNVG